MIVYAVDASAASLSALFGINTNGSVHGGDGDSGLAGGSTITVGSTHSLSGDFLSWVSMKLWGDRGGITAGGSGSGRWDKETLIWYMIGDPPFLSTTLPFFTRILYYLIHIPFISYAVSQNVNILLISLPQTLPSSHGSYGGCGIAACGIASATRARSIVLWQTIPSDQSTLQR